jgi:hypothetical protein
MQVEALHIVEPTVVAHTEDFMFCQIEELHFSTASLSYRKRNSIDVMRNQLICKKLCVFASCPRVGCKLCRVDVEI